MTLRLPGQPAGIAVTLAVAAALAVAACGEQHPTAHVTPSQLPDMILQPEDLPESFSYDLFPASPAVEARAPMGRVAGYRLKAELPHAAANAGDLVCVSAALDLHETIETAKTRWKEFDEAFENSPESPASEEIEWRRISVPSLGDEAGGYFLSARSNWCSWEDTQVEAVIVGFRKGRLWAAVGTFTLEHGASSDEAIALAQKQLTRIDATLAGG